MKCFFIDTKLKVSHSGLFLCKGRLNPNQLHRNKLKRHTSRATENKNVGTPKLSKQNLSSGASMSYICVNIRQKKEIIQFLLRTKKKVNFDSSSFAKTFCPAKYVLANLLDSILRYISL